MGLNLEDGKILETSEVSARGRGRTRGAGGRAPGRELQSQCPGQSGLWDETSLGLFPGSPLTLREPGGWGGGHTAPPPSYRLGKRLRGLEFTAWAPTQNPKPPALNPQT